MLLAVVAALALTLGGTIAQPALADDTVYAEWETDLGWGRTMWASATLNPADATLRGVARASAGLIGFHGLHTFIFRDGNDRVLGQTVIHDWADLYQRREHPIEQDVPSIDPWVARHTARIEIKQVWFPQEYAFENILRGLREKGCVVWDVVKRYVSIGDCPFPPIEVHPTQNHLPIAVLAWDPASAATGQTIEFNAGGSVDPDGNLVRFEWDLDDDGTYETDTGTRPVVTHAFDEPGDHLIRLRVTDNDGGTASSEQTLTIGNRAPHAVITFTPSRPVAGSRVTFSAAASSDLDGHVTHYAWDLDGNGDYEVDGMQSARTARTFDTAGSFAVGVRVTDDEDATSTATVQVVVGDPVTPNEGDALPGPDSPGDGLAPGHATPTSPPATTPGTPVGNPAPGKPEEGKGTNGKPSTGRGTNGKPTGTGTTGKRARAIKRCKRIGSPHRRARCVRRAKRLPR